MERCGAALPPGRVICDGCTTKARMDLREVPVLLVELDDAISRQTSMPPGAGTLRCTRENCGHGPDEPGCVQGVRLDLDTRASDASLALRLTLHGWARVWDEETPVPPGPWPIGPICEWLPCGHLSCHRIGFGPTLQPIRDRDMSSARRQALALAFVADLGSRPWAYDLAREVRDAVHEGWAAVDRPADAAVVGRCPECGRALYGPEGAAVVRCQGCGTTAYRVDVREASLAESRTLVTAAQMGVALGIDPARVRQWAKRGRIVKRRDGMDGRPLYRVSDGQALLARGDDEEMTTA